MSKKAVFALTLVVLLIPLSLWITGLVNASTTDEASVKTDLKKSITVSGEGKIYTPSDEASLTFAVRTIRKTASQAMSDNSLIMAKVLAAIRSKSLTDDEVKTGNISLYPQEDWRNGKGPRVVSYTAENRVVVKTKKLDKLGDIIDAATTAGATEVSELRFQLSEDNIAQQDALKIAVRNARKKAEVLAKELDVNLGKAISVSESINPSPIVPYNNEYLKAKLSYDQSMAPPVMPQDIQVITYVTISFGIN